MINDSAARIIRILGWTAGLVLPLSNIAFILKLRRRRSSQDVSLSAIGLVWLCLMLMLPAALISPDPIFTWSTIINAGLVTVLVIHVIRYR